MFIIQTPLGFILACAKKTYTNKIYTIDRLVIPEPMKIGWKIESRYYIGH